MRRKKVILWSLLGVALAVGGAIWYFIYPLLSFANNIHAGPGESKFHFPKTEALSNAKGGEDLTPPKWEGKERVNILLLGGDSRGMKENEIPRSDSIMVVSIDPVTKKSYLFSILRDTYVRIPNHGMDRINTAISTGGPELAMKTVSNLMGIPIQYYVYTDFKGFIELVDAVGGIDLEVEKDMKYRDSEDGHEFDIDLKKGYQHLDGKKSLQYVRFRHDAMSDFSRTERQRKFMGALADKLQSTTSLIKLPRILQSIDPYIETNLAVTQMLKLGALGFEVKTDGMVSQQVPPPNLLEEKRVSGAEVIGVDPRKLQTYVKTLFGDSNKVPAATKAPGSGSSKLSLGAGIEADPDDQVRVPAASPKATLKPAATPKPTKKPAASVKPIPSPTPSTGKTGGKASAPPAVGVTPKPSQSPAPKPSAGTGAGSGSAGTTAGEPGSGTGGSGTGSGTTGTAGATGSVGTTGATGATGKGASANGGTSGGSGTGTSAGAGQLLPSVKPGG